MAAAAPRQDIVMAGLFSPHADLDNTSSVAFFLLLLKQSPSLLVVSVLVCYLDRLLPTSHRKYLVLMTDTPSEEGAFWASIFGEKHMLRFFGRSSSVE